MSNEHLRSLGKSESSSRRSRIALLQWLIVCCRIRLTFTDKDGVESTFEVAKGDNLLSIAQSEDLEMEGSIVRQKNQKNR